MGVRPGLVLFLNMAATTVSSLAVAGCSLSDSKRPIAGDPRAGANVIARQACGSCHQIPGVQLATGLVGPPLEGIASRVYLAGGLRNTPDNLVSWLRNPQAVVPGNAMPDMGLTDEEARDVAAYLISLR